MREGRPNTRLTTRSVHATHVLRAVSAALLVSVMAGCGQTHRRDPRAPGAPGAPRAEHVLVRAPLAGGGYFVIGVVQHQEGGREQAELQHHFEVLTTHGMQPGGWSSGPRLGGVEPRTLAIHVDHGCSSGNPYALAVGLLQAPRDTVTARSTGHPVALKRAVIPARFAPHGVLVYGLLGPAATKIVTRTPTGRLLSNESFGGQEAISCEATANRETSGLRSR
jgi:hypothetical protein